MNLSFAYHIKKMTCSVSLLTIFLSLQSVQAEQLVEDYLDLELEDLLSMEVTSVSKTKQRLTETASAVFVITQEDIRRSGVTSIPEALRMAPGMQVAQIDANKWTVSTRGFNSQFANKLLVLIDGRSIYTTTFSGVYWDMQDTLMDDIDRIEIIRGPGATLWGANAMNGVINIITKHTAVTEGGQVTLGGGKEEKGFASLRYGLELGEHTRGRFYAKILQRDSYQFESNGQDAGDSWESLHSGFRLDGISGDQDSWTLQGDIFETEANQTVGSVWLDPNLIDPASFADPVNGFPTAGTVIETTQTGVTDIIENSGWNLLGRWNHTLNNLSNTSLQIYSDFTQRKENFLQQQHHTLDIDFQHNLLLGDYQEIVWGLGYRRTEDEFENSFSVSINPDHSTFELYSAFIQDKFELVPDRLFLTLGSKFEHNDYTGTEVQPGIRGLWKVDNKSSVWGAISRAVRTPSRLEHSGHLTVFSGVTTTGNPFFPVVPLIGTINGSEEFESEESIVYELGYRVQPAENLSLDVAIFYNDYDGLLSLEIIDLASEFGNKVSGHSSGVEIVADWSSSEWWRVKASYSTMSLTLKQDADSLDKDLAVIVGEGSSPRHQFSLRSTMDLNDQWEMDWWIYYVDPLDASSFSAQLNNIQIDSYTSLNARIGWRPDKNLELSLALLNVQGDEHLEVVGEFYNELIQVERTVYAKLRWQF